MKLELQPPATEAGLASLTALRETANTLDPHLDSRLLLRIVAAERRHGATTHDTKQHALEALKASDQAESDLRYFISELVLDGDIELASTTVADAGKLMTAQENLRTEHSLAMLTRSDQEAANTEDQLRLVADTENGNVDRLRAERLSLFDHHRELVEAWSKSSVLLRDMGGRACRSFLFLGNAGRAGELLRTPGATGPEAKTALIATERRILLGDLDGALAGARWLLPHAYSDVPTLRVVAEVFRRAGDVDDTELRYELRHSTWRKRRAAHLERLVISFVELGRMAEVLELIDLNPRSPAGFGPHGLYALAQTYYAARRFADAAALLKRLDGSRRHWDAHKLTGRILLEQGRFGDALAQRSRHGRPTGLIDEVSYHCHLQLREYSEAFSMYCSPADQRRIRREMSDASHVIDDETKRLLIVAQSGPGDEIQLASTYAGLETARASLTVTSDPRLAPLIQRSFPNTEVIPVARRTRPLQWGFLAADSPARSGDDLSDLLTREARARSAESDTVVLARELAARSVSDGAPIPSRAYLRPDQAKVAAHRQRLGAQRPAVGIVWRSEVRSLMRSIHYLDINELGPILEVPATFVCLQHDIDPTERAYIRERLGPRILFPTHVDLREDLDNAAALVAALDAVVGVGTTLVELAGAVGTPTVLVQPNHFGSWRSSNGAGNDHWHQSARVATVTGPNNQKACVGSAARILRDMVVES